MEPLKRDPYLWQKAKARTRFQSHLVTYVVVNCGLWVLWAFTDRQHDGGIPWPIWSTVFWGIGLVMSGIGAYGGFNREQRTQREYERLMREEGTGNLDRYR
ncbi:2TM domain-containing protein [Hymenobacter terricola]|uniref:2TM domain-containing protein n=1 Tax=Hymenobacter terricola TaxID=2819236 RepID=UPI001B304DDB|nr:2TM domain-containing protein [Hymenobacter terricola]